MPSINLTAQRAVVLLTAAALAACTATVTGTPTPAPPRQSAAADGLPPGVPKVANPIDISRFLQAACTMLTPPQLAVFKVRAAGHSRTDGLGQVCDWDDGGGPSGMTLTTGFVTSGGGLSGTYANRNNIRGFRELPPIDGFPAVIANIGGTKDEANGICSIDVGASDTVVVTIVVQISGDEVGRTPRRTCHEVAELDCHRGEAEAVRAAATAGAGGRLLILTGPWNRTAPARLRSARGPLVVWLSPIGPCGAGRACRRRRGC